MISEKTVELNVSNEMLNWATWATGRHHYALAPSQRREGRLGYDVAIRGPGTAVLVQFKRAYVSGPIWTWHLNRTSRRDQHARLQRMEGKGVPVLYAFPLFHTQRELQLLPRRLMWNTLWMRPSKIMPSGGPTGHHDVNWDSNTGRLWVASTEPRDIGPMERPDAIMSMLDDEKYRKNLQHIIEVFNAEMDDDHDDHVESQDKRADEGGDISAITALVRPEGA